MSLVRDERHDRMDKKNDHSRKHGQRNSFIDACAAKDCDAFHSFPPSRQQCESRRAVTLHCFGERGVIRNAALLSSLLIHRLDDEFDLLARQQLELGTIH